MKKIMYWIAFLTLVGCSGGKFGALTKENISADPKVMELKGGQVTVTVNGTFPDKFFPKKGELAFIPTIVTPKGEISGDEIIFYGEKVKNPGLLVVPYKTGGTFSETQSFAYTDDMKMSELYAVFEAKDGSKSVALPRVKLADGVITTCLLVNRAEAAPMLSSEALEGKSVSSQTGTIMYVIQQANIRKSELKKADMIALTNTLKKLSSNKQEKLTSIQILSAASPDGSEGLNSRLAKKREAASNKYINAELKKFNIKTSIQNTVIDEDWDGLYAGLAASNLKNKNQMIQTLKSEKNRVKRQAILQRYINSDKILETQLLPPLRKSVITFQIEKEGVTIDWVMSMMQKDPSKLSLNDWLYGATQLTSDTKKIDAYKQLIKMYPNDWRAYNNLATVYMNQKNWKEATSLLNQSLKLQKTPEATFNLGLVYLAQGDINDAEAQFANLPASPKWNDAQGTIAIILGDYPAAVSLFGNTASNNAALAQILNKDYSKAESTLSKIKDPNATTYYLMAVLGARTNNKNMVLNNLKQVARMDRALTEYARTDIEFAKYMNECQFSSVLK